MAHSNNPSTSDFNAPESLVADQSVIAWDWMNGLSTTNDVDILIDDILSPMELPGDAFALVSGAPGTGGLLVSRGQSVPDIQDLLKTGAKSGVAGASQTAEVIILKSCKKRGIVAQKINEASPKRSKTLVTQADANPKACSGIRTAVPATAETSPDTQRTQLIGCIQKANTALKSGEYILSIEYKALPGNEKLVDILYLQWELAYSACEAPSGARSVLKKSARDFLDDEPDVLILQLKVALVVLKKAAGDYKQAVKERSDRREAVAVAKKAKLIACIKEKLVRDYQRAAGDASKTLDDLS
nr:hypothetical protein B0A51_05114 [Rachicladosporium sp. CCFEE 5018]